MKTKISEQLQRPGMCIMKVYRIGWGRETLEQIMVKEFKVSGKNDGRNCPPPIWSVNFKVRNDEDIYTQAHHNQPA